MSSDVTKELRRLQKKLQTHADGICGTISLVLLDEAKAAERPVWKRDFERVRQSAHEIYRVATERLAPTLYADGRPTIDAELFVIRHELRGLLQNVFGRCHLVSTGLTDPKVAREIAVILEHAQGCLEALDGQRDGTAPCTSSSTTDFPWTPLPVPMAPDSGARARILVADDNADSRETLGRFLASRGHEVLFATTGQETLASVAANEFDLILLDLLMPAPNGIEVLTHLRRENKLERTSVIIISGLDAATNASLAIRLGAVEYLTRPVDFGRLSARVEICLERQRAKLAEESARNYREEMRKAELEMARSVQKSFSPPGEATYGPLYLQAFLEQAGEVGGDCFFHHQVGGEAVLVGVGDITGKGFPAAIDMGRLATLVDRSAADCRPETFAQWLVELNNQLHGIIKGGDNAAALSLLLFDPERRRVHVAAFAQPPPLNRDQVTGLWRTVPCPANSFFGQRKLRECGVAVVPLATGSHWLLYSDGITEATLAGGEPFGRQGLVDFLLQREGWPAMKIDTLVADWHALLRERGEDDATLLLVQDLTPPPPRQFAGLLTPEEISEAHGFFEQWGRFAGLTENATIPLVIGCDEILTNIYRHAYDPLSPPGPFSCAAVVEPSLLRFIIRHVGKGLSHQEADASTGQPAEEGGMGLSLVRRVFSRVHFGLADAAGGAEIVLEKDF